MPDQKIIVISSYVKLKQIADEVIRERGLNIESAFGELQDGVRIAQQAKKEGKEIIISRGGTAQVIRENVDLPVIEIQVTGYDILRALIKYKDETCKFGIVGYDNVIHGSRLICNMLGINIEHFNIESEEQVIPKLQDASRIGIACIIGDTISVNTAKKMGLRYDLIESGKEAIAEAIDKAINVYELTLKERKEKQQLQAILDFSHEGIIAIDKDGKIALYNRSAEKIFGIPSRQVIGENIVDAIPNTRMPDVLKSGQKELGKLQKAGNVLLATNRVPIIIKNQVIGAVATFQDVTKIQELEQKIRQKISAKGLMAKHTFSDIVGASPSITRIVSLAKKFGGTDSTILIYGESGTGKELFAQSIHNVSQRGNGPFVAVNCVALPGNLLESELFGYAEGAFTGARKGGKKGLFELAHNGTIFLDEVGEMDKHVQSRMLRVIQEKEVMRIGDDKVFPVDVRIIAATNKNLKQEVEFGNFREDLFYRLNVLTLEIPPLRKRKGDIEILFKYFVKKLCQKHSSRLKEINPGVLGILKNYNWPGNIRELQNIVEKLIIISEETITERDVEDILVTEQTGFIEHRRSPEDFMTGTLHEITRNIILKVLEEEDYNKSRAAARLGIDRGTLNRKLRHR